MFDLFQFETSVAVRGRTCVRPTTQAAAASSLSTLSALAQLLDTSTSLQKSTVSLVAQYMGHDETMFETFQERAAILEIEVGLPDPD